MKILTLFLSLTTLSTVFAQKQTFGYFWHLTDFHLDTSYWSNPRNARNQSEFSSSGKYAIEKCWLEGGGRFGDYNCDSPMALIKSAITFVKEKSLALTPRPNFVLWTRDDTVHADDTHFSEDIVVDLIRQNTEAIQPLHNSMNIYPVLGNHDAYEKSQFSSHPEPGDLYHQVADLWANFLSATAQEDFKKGGYYYISRSETNLPFHLVGLNTNIYYKSNHLVEDTESDPLDQFHWLKTKLTDFQNKNEKALLFAHISPGKFERYYEQTQKDEEYEGFHWFTEDFNQKFIDEIILPFNETIVAQFFGHHHTDTFKLFNDGDNIVASAFLTPAITPWRSTLSTETGSNNPAVRLVKFDAATGEIVDIIQYWLNLKEANANDRADWKELYTFTEYYGLKDLSTESLNFLSQHLEPGVNETKFNLYYSANSVNYDEYLEYNCTLSCQRTQYCSIIRQRYQEFNKCYQETADSSASLMQPTFFATIFVYFSCKIF